MRFLAACALVLTSVCTETASLNLPVEHVDGDVGIFRRQIPATTATTIIDVNQDPSGALNATAWALIYTYPLAIFSSWAGGVLRSYTVNQIFHQRALATPTDPGVIKPNVDTLYSRVVLDLSQNDVVLTVPNITDGRYWVYPVYDPFGNNQAEIGVVNGNPPGDYLIRRADDVFAAPGYDNDTRHFNSSLYKGVVNLPGSYGTMLIRLLLLANTTADLNAVNTYQNATRLTPINRTAPYPVQPYTTPAPPLTSLALNGSLLGIQTPAQQLEFAARLIPYNQPEVYSERYRVAVNLALAGLYRGHYTQPAGVNLTQAAVIANASITADVQNQTHIRQQSNEWQLSIPEYQGDFTTHYSSTAYVALAGYQQQTVKQTLYPGFRSLGFSSVFTLPTNGALLLTFSSKPKLIKPGFWSLSVYGADQYLIPNSLNQFEVGDRNYDMKYPDGGYVYGPNANASRDGSFQILVQPANQPPPANWTGNWLPASTTFSWIRK